MRALLARACRATSATVTPSNPRAAKSVAAAFRSDFRVAFESWLRRGRFASRLRTRAAVARVIVLSRITVMLNQLYNCFKHSANTWGNDATDGESTALRVTRRWPC